MILAVFATASYLVATVVLDNSRFLFVSANTAPALFILVSLIYIVNMIVLFRPLWS